MKREYMHLYFFLLFLFWSQVTFSQRNLNATEWYDTIISIEESQVKPIVKKEQWEQLLSSYENHHSKKDSLYARIIHNLGISYWETGNFDEGIQYLKKAVKINQSSDPLSDDSFLANSFYNLGVYYNNLNLIEEFHHYMDSSIAISKKYSQKSYIGIHAYEQIALFYFNRGEFHKSIETVDYGLLFSQDVSSSEYKALLLLQKTQAELEIGIRENDIDYLNKAESNIKKALQIFSNINADYDHWATAYSINALWLTYKEKFDEAVYYYQKAIDYSAKSDNKRKLFKIYGSLGSLYDDMGKPRKALEYYYKSVELIQEIGDVNELAVVYNNLGVVFFKNDDFEMAIQYFHRGLNTLSTGFTDTVWHNNPTYLDIKSVSNDRFFLTLLKNKSESIYNLYQKDSISEFLTYALDSYKAADKAIDQMRWNQSNLESKLLWRKTLKKMFDEAIEVCYLLNDVENALYFFEKSRAVLLNDKLSELGAQKFLSPEDQENEKMLFGKVASFRKKLFLSKKTDPKYSATSMELFTSQETYDKFIKGLETKYPNYYQYKYDTSMVSVADLKRDIIEDDQTFISYFTGSKYLYTLTVDADSAFLTRTKLAPYLEKATEMMALSADQSQLNQHYPRFRELAHELYAELFQPLPIRTKRIVISPDDHLIPFELLLTDKEDPTSFLLQDHAFSYTYSAGYLIKNKTEKKAVTASLLGMAPVNYQPHLKQIPLQGADLSLNNINKFFSSSKNLLHEQATKKEFLENLPKHSVVQLFTHAEADTEGTEPTLYFADSAFLVSELQMLGPLSTTLIILSACNTGVGKVMKGEGIFSLARGFAAAGIPSSITSLWQIDNQSTYQLSEMFHQFLNQGLPLDIALQEAKLEFLRIQDKSYDLPYFWAASILVGRSEGFLPEKENYFFRYSNLMAGMLLLLFFISAFLYYKKSH
jgi:CHAT domain-containing protein/tetratricopeptide (TPR) repeat protein